MSLPNAVVLSAVEAAAPAPSRTCRRWCRRALGIQGRKVLVAGDSNAGKFWVTGLMCEQLILHSYSLRILDPEGDYASLKGLPGVVVVGADPLLKARDLMRTLRHADVSIVIDFWHTSNPAKLKYVCNVLPALATLRVVPQFQTVDVPGG